MTSRRALAGTEQAEDPTFFPNGGTFHDPIAVSLVSDDGAVVYYTTDGTVPDGTSTFVTSSELVVLEESVTIRAIAAFQGEDFDARSSAEVEASFVVYVAGRLTAFVPTTQPWKRWWNACPGGRTNRIAFIMLHETDLFESIVSGTCR